MLRNYVNGFLALDEELVCDTEPLGYFENLVVELVALVNIDTNPVLAYPQGFLEGENAAGVGGYAVRPFQPELFQLGQSEVAYRALAVGAAIQCPVMGQYEYGVLRHLQVELHNVSPHIDD